jgi:hypothetical protein
MGSKPPIPLLWVIRSLKVPKIGVYGGRGLTLAFSLCKTYLQLWDVYHFIHISLQLNCIFVCAQYQYIVCHELWDTNSIFRWLDCLVVCLDLNCGFHLVWANYPFWQYVNLLDLAYMDHLDIWQLIFIISFISIIWAFITIINSI